MSVGDRNDRDVPTGVLEPAEFLEGLHLRSSQVGRIWPQNRLQEMAELRPRQSTTSVSQACRGQAGLWLGTVARFEAATPHRGEGAGVDPAACWLTVMRLLGKGGDVPSLHACSNNPAQQGVRRWS